MYHIFWWNWCNWRYVNLLSGLGIDRIIWLLFLILLSHQAVITFFYLHHVVCNEWVSHSLTSSLTTFFFCRDKVWWWSWWGQWGPENDVRTYQPTGWIWSKRQHQSSYGYKQVKRYSCIKSKPRFLCYNQLSSDPTLSLSKACNKTAVSFEALCSWCFYLLTLKSLDQFLCLLFNRPDTLDPALTRPGRLDRKVEFGLPDLEVHYKHIINTTKTHKSSKFHYDIID